MAERKAWMSLAELKKQPVIITECKDNSQENVQQALDICIEGMGGLSWVKKGMTVAIKVNMVASMAPEKGATTDPALVRELGRRLTQRGARVIVGDSPGGIFTKPYVEAVCRGCHMQEALSEGVVLNDDFSVKDAVFDRAASIRTFTYTGWLDQADAIINFSKLKTHAMMSMSCSVKNLFGTIPGTKKPEYHMRFPDKQQFADLMVDLNEYFKPVFNFVDGIIAMEGNGPTAGTPRHAGVLLASRSPYNLDMVCANLIGLGRSDVPTLEAAYRRGLGPESISEISIEGDMEKHVMPDFHLVTRHQSITFSGDSLLMKIFSGAARWALATRPQVTRSECIGCRKCFHVCPAKAITMKNGKPDIDRKKCIHCFCCQEFCPKGAMKVHHNPVGKVISAVNTAGQHST